MHIYSKRSGPSSGTCMIMQSLDNNNPKELLTIDFELLPINFGSVHSSQVNFVCETTTIG
jgi:hypothetical protein